MRTSPPAGNLNPPVTFGARRRREEHESTTAPRGPRLLQGTPIGGLALLSGPLAEQETDALLLDVELTETDSYAEPDAAETMIERSVTEPALVGTDRANDMRDFV